MLGIKLFKKTPGVKPIELPYEIRSIEYIEHEKGWFIAGGDKSGKLIVFRYDGVQPETIIEHSFGFKISSLDFIMYGEKEQYLGLIVALNVEEHANLFFNPNILQQENRKRKSWYEIKHPKGTPRLVLQPYVTKELNKIFFSFKDGYFIISSLEKSSNGDYYNIVKEWDHQFPSRIVDGCVDFPKYLKRTRQSSGDKDNHIYLASKAGCILILKIYRDWKFSDEKEKILHRLRVIPNSIRYITPLSKIPDAADTMRGILGITATDFFCLYRRSEASPERLNYQILTERFPNSLHTLAVGNYKNPDKETGTTNIILVGDSQNAINARQFSRALTPSNIAEVLFEKRRIFREKMEDRIFGIVPINRATSPQIKDSTFPLLELVFGLGNHKIVFRNLVNKVHIAHQIKERLGSDLGLSNDTPLKKIIEAYIEKAREFESDLMVKYDLMASVFDHKDSENGRSLAMSCLTVNDDREQKQELLDMLIRLTYWTLSSGDKHIFLHVYRKVCDLIQEYNEEIDWKGEHKWLYRQLDQLLSDIDKFWIGGESYSKKKGDLFKLIGFNEKNQKPLDLLIYKACINDRAFTVENSKSITKHKIRAIARYEDILFVSDKGGNLHLYDSNFSKICAPFDINEYSMNFYGINTPAPALQRNNFIRQIVFNSKEKFGIFLFQSGGLWIFPLRKLTSLIRNNDPDLYKKIEKIFFLNSQNRLAGRDIKVYRLKQIPTNGEIFFSDVQTRFHKMQVKNQGGEFNVILSTLKAPYIPNEYAPIFDFDFLDTERVVFGDVSGKITIFDLNTKRAVEIQIPTAPHINICTKIDEKTTIFGTREGKILAYDFSGNHPVCKWTYSLTAKVRFIQETNDKKLVIGGLCPEALVLDLSGRFENVLDFSVYTKKKEKYLDLIQAILPLPEETADYPGQHLLIVAGDQQGNIKKIRFYHPNIYEGEIRNYIDNISNEPEKARVKLRTINIRENSLRRHYTALESRSWNYLRLKREIECFSNSKNFQLHNGPLVYLIPRFVSAFIDTCRAEEQGNRSQQLYTEFYQTANELVNGWRLKNDLNCQAILRILGINIFRVLMSKHMAKAPVRIARNVNNPNIQEFLVLINHIHIHCTPFTLVHMYEDIRQELVKLSENGHGDFNMDVTVDFICQKLGGIQFDKHMPDALPRKLVELLAFMVEPLGYCPIKLAYKLFNADVGIAILTLLANQIKNENNLAVFQSFHRFADKLLKLENISDELSIINCFPSRFPGHFTTAESVDPFYREFSFIFNCTQTILNFSDAMAIASSDSIPVYEKRSMVYFGDLIASFTLIIEKISFMKNIFQQCLDPSSSKPIPVNELVSTRDEFQALIEMQAEKIDMGELYNFLLNKINKHIFDILSIFCEVTLPILCLENTATFLEEYLDGIRKKEQPLPALDNPDSLEIYNLYFRQMFKALIVGLKPKKALFYYPMIINFNKTKRCDILFINGDYLTGEKEPDVPGNFEKDGDQTLKAEELLLHLPDMTQQYGSYKFYFSQTDTMVSQFRERFFRFQGFVSILNLYLMAFNDVAEAEMQSRFSHRLFAHQSKEPLIAIRNHLKVLNSSGFQDPDGSKTKEYYGRMLRNADQLIKRSDYILNVRKLFRHAKPNISRFRLEPILNEVAHNMRKVMESLSCNGDIVLNHPKEQEDIVITSDESKIRELLEQLIKNSIKYCDGNRMINVSLKYDRENIRLKVKDNGVGIPNNELPYIFSPYFRGEFGETKNIDGDGLGLWVAKTYSDMLGGIIDVRSKTKSKKEESGTTFTVIIPRKLKIVSKSEEKNVR